MRSLFSFVGVICTGLFVSLNASSAAEEFNDVDLQEIYEWVVQDFELDQEKGSIFHDFLAVLQGEEDLTEHLNNLIKTYKSNPDNSSAMDCYQGALDLNIPEVHAVRLAIYRIILNAELQGASSLIGSQDHLDNYYLLLGSFSLLYFISAYDFDPGLGGEKPSMDNNADVYVFFKYLSPKFYSEEMMINAEQVEPDIESLFTISEEVDERCSSMMELFQEHCFLGVRLSKVGDIEETPE